MLRLQKITSIDHLNSFVPDGYVTKSKLHQSSLIGSVSTVLCHVELLLLGHCLGGHDFRKALQPRCLEPCDPLVDRKAIKFPVG